MAWDDEADTTIYHVVVNDEEQYSIWPEYKDIPQGWRAVGQTGPKQACLDYTLRGHKLRFLDCPHPSPLPEGEGEQSRNL